MKEMAHLDLSCMMALLGGCWALSKWAPPSFDPGLVESAVGEQLAKELPDDVLEDKEFALFRLADEPPVALGTFCTSDRASGKQDPASS